MSVLLLCGGVGGAKLALGLSTLLPPDQLTILVNTGDDFEHCGLTICPDLDTVMYTLAGVVNPEFGWGRADETTSVMQELATLGGPAWFKLGDRDIALHLLRLEALRQGRRLTEITAMLCARLGVKHTLLPMSDQPVPTLVETEAGLLPFQEYFVGRRCAPVVQGFRFKGAAQATPPLELDAVLRNPALRGIIIAPSNPYVSVGPILAIPGLRQRLRDTGVPVIAVSPIIGDRAIKGPAAKMLQELGQTASALAIARYYGDFIDTLLIDDTDAALLDRATPDLPRLATAATLMHTLEDKQHLGQVCLDLLTALRR